MIINVLDSRTYQCPQPLNPPGPIACVGAQCMAWRWNDTRKVYGFCGMAGEPVSSVIEKTQEE